MWLALASASHREDGCPPLAGISDLWCLDVILNNELLEEYEQCISLTLAHTRPLL